MMYSLLSLNAKQTLLSAEKAQNKIKNRQTNKQTKNKTKKTCLLAFLLYDWTKILENKGRLLSSSSLLL